jgi:hypothetical protein
MLKKKGLENMVTTADKIGGNCKMQKKILFRQTVTITNDQSQKTIGQVDDLFIIFWCNFSGNCFNVFPQFKKMPFCGFCNSDVYVYVFNDIRRNGLYIGMVLWINYGTGSAGR